MNLLDIDITGYDTLLLDRDGVINRLRPNDYVNVGRNLNSSQEFLKH